MRNSYAKYTLLYIFAYFAIGVLTPLISQYLKSINFSGTQIGTVTSAGTLIAIFASTFWGRVYANNTRRHLVVLSLCLAAAVTAILLSHIYAFAAFIMIYAVMYFFQAPIMALNDAMAIDDEQQFGFVRMWGAVGFAGAVFIAARVAAKIGLGSIFIMYACAYVAAAFIIFLIYCHSKESHQRSEVKTVKKRYRDLKGNKRLIELIICAFFLCGTNVANNTYFSFLYIQGGGTLAGVGLAFLLMAGSETPFMAWSVSLARRFTTEKIILFAMIVSVVRFACYATGPSYIFLLSTFLLQGFVNGIILVEFVRYVSKLVSTEYNGVAIAAYYAFSSNMSTIVCQMFGGIILDHAGASGVYLFFSLFNLAGLILYLVFGLHKKQK